jgi:hypothetical protein
LYFSALEIKGNAEVLLFLLCSSAMKPGFTSKAGKGDVLGVLSYHSKVSVKKQETMRRHLPAVSPCMA